MLDDNAPFVAVLVVGCFVASGLGAVLAVAYWRLWGRVRFDRRLTAAVDAEITRSEEQA